MGTNNRERRRAKKQKRRRVDGPRHGARRRPLGPAGGTDGRRAGESSAGGGRLYGAGGRTLTELVRGTVLGAAEAFRFQPEAVYRSRLGALSALEDRVGQAEIDAAVSWWVERGLDRAWATGWQPADVVRAVHRALTPAHACLLGPAVAESGARRPEAAADDRWAGQVADLGAGLPGTGHRPRWPDVALAVETVAVLLRLPPLPRLSGGSREAGSARCGDSGAMLERVRALLAKAESTTFPEEAELLTAKAQELMARHAIDQAMLDAGRGCRPAAVLGWRIGVDDPYAAAKSLLLDRIAAANRCRAVWSKDFGFSTVFGAGADLQTAELLFTSLLVQAADAMLRAGPSVDRWGRSRTRSFRQSFLVSYASRIGERLAAASAEVVAEAAERHGDQLLPVLAGRVEAVGEAVRATFPDMVEQGLRVTNPSGWVAGRAAAEQASLALGEELPAG